MKFCTSQDTYGRPVTGTSLGLGYFRGALLQPAGNGVPTQNYPLILDFHYMYAILALFATAVLLLASWNSPRSALALCHEGDLAALVDFKASLINGSSRLGNWDESVSCCEWVGIECDTSSPARVVNISLHAKGLHGRALQALGNIASLQILNLSSNSLSGDLPSQLTALSRLQQLDLSSNNLSEGLGVCTNLQVLELGGNKLQGHIPLDIYNLSALTWLSFAKNNFTGNLDRAVGSLLNLQYLMLDQNNFTGPLPANLSACTKLKVFSVSDNKFEGSLDMIQFNKLPMLETVDLNSNSFHGSIPSSLAGCAALLGLNLAKNNFTGAIPMEFSGLKNLSSLALSSNNLNGSLRLLVGSEQLVSIILSKNDFNETLPDTVEGEGLSNLQVLALGYLHLRGHIPQWLKNCTKLQVLDLSWNHLDGPIPSWLGLFPHLFYVDFSNNSFSGHIPVELFGLPTLIHGDKNTTGLQVVVNNLAIKNKQSSPELRYTQVSAFPPSVYLSHNQLQGPIPLQVGAFAELLNMDLSFNNLSGTIPESMASMTDLELLDLSSNKLTGSIPSSLSNLTFLASFNVSHNQLVGMIPQGNQFSTFSNKSYEGNADLCGPPLSMLCQDDKAKSTSLAPFSKRSLNARIAILVPVCLVVGLLVVLSAWFSWRLSRRNVVYVGSVSFKDLDGPQNLAEALDSSVQLFCSRGKLTVFDLFKATNNFDSANIVGCGGFGLVYRADLADGTKLAIKKLTGDCGQMEREFRAEVETLSKAQHRNLVPLQGYLQIGNERLLLYSYMENGSLDYWLHERIDGGNCLDWPTRLKIAQGAAHGLAYLHQVCDPHVVHRDIKSSNILLDEKFQAHLADFGLARLMMSTDTHVTTEVVGTLGYIPPEYCHALNATPRGDIYSFGVVLLELLTRRRPVDICKGKGAGDLVPWVLQWQSIGRAEEIFDTSLLNKGHEEQMLQVLDVACPCISLDPAKRPSIGDVVNWLDQIGLERDSMKPVC
ncbi:hypothetical protein GOP47_0015480 [Adiantum capillus-veneris]|uniref:non-specific serine/threonine protein kinase n=1 Tax=Adiantum capillus-veneris TaxID=13818 RepID=A0A9D4UKG0_ADICA|nr:hypothetical protein GOP47_0015480 [Adiantum capillus-veneris]